MALDSGARLGAGMAHRWGPRRALGRAAAKDGLLGAESEVARVKELGGAREPTWGRVLALE